MPQPWAVVFQVSPLATFLVLAVRGRYMTTRGQGSRSGLHFKLSNEREHTLDIYTYWAHLWWRRVVLVDGQEVKPTTRFMSVRSAIEVQVGDETPYRLTVFRKPFFGRMVLEIDGDPAATL